MINEATITINGKTLTQGQSMTIRMAVSSFAFELQNKSFCESLGPIAVGYQARVNEIVDLINEELCA